MKTTTSILHRLLGITALLVTLNCVAQPNSPRFIGAIVYPNSPQCSNPKAAGGFSGITFYNDTFYIVSDAKTEQGGPRVYKYNIPYTANEVKQPIALDTVILPPHYTLGDCEAICYHNNSLYISNETDPGQLFYVTQLSLNNTVQNAIPYPEPFVAGIHHLKWNGMESMTVTRDGNIWFMSEDPLQFAPDANKGYRRLACMNTKGRLLAQYFYSPRQGYRPSDILAINDTSFLVMEVKYLRDSDLVKVTINQVNIAGTAEIPNETDLKYDTLVKTLVLDVNADNRVMQAINAADNGTAKVDNFEGMCWGRTLPNGHRTLVLVADDNFACYNGRRNNQHTEILIFEWP